MKKTIAIALISFFFNNIYSQNSLKILEEAYAYFNAKKYNNAAKSFEKYITLTEGSKLDHYFLAASLAYTGKTNKALIHCEKASTGIESIATMLANPLFCPIHKQLQEKYEQLKNFYDFHNQAYYYDQNTSLKKLDSLYHCIDFKKVIGYDLIQLSERYSYAKDTLKALFYLNEALTNGNMHPMISNKVFRLLDSYENQYPKYYKEYFPYMEKVKKWITLYNQYQWNSKFDSVAYALEKLYTETPHIFSTPDLLYNTACGFSLSGNYEKAGDFLVKALDAGFNDLKHLFQDNDLHPLFNSQQGQHTLKYIISKHHKDAFINADNTFESTSQEYTKSKRIIYDYLKAKNFDAQIPRAFEIFHGNGKTLHVPLFWEDRNIQTTDFEYVYSLDSNNRIKVSNPINKNSKIVLYKNTNNPIFGDNAGNCYIFPSENERFIIKVQQGDILLSNIHQIRSNHLTPFMKNAYAAKIHTGIDSDDETFLFAIENGIEHTSPSLVTLLKETTPIQLTEIIKYASYTLNHSASFDILINITKDTSYHKSLPDSKRRQHLDIVSSFWGILPFRELIGDDESLLPTFDYNRERNEGYITRVNKTISEWWNNYKYENPFKLPETLFDSTQSSTKIDMNTWGHFYIDSSNNRPIHYNPIDQTINTLDSTYNLISNNFIKTGTIGNYSYIFTPSHHTNPDELLLFPKIDSSKLSQLQLIANSLNLKPNERISTERGGFDIKYDRFYTTKAFDDYVYIWHNNDSIFINKLSKNNNYNYKQNILIAAKQKECFNDTVKYFETPYCLNSLKSIEIDQKLYILCNSSISKTRNCRHEYYQNTYLLKINKKLEIEKAIDIPQEYIENFDPTGNPDVELITTVNKIFAFIWPECCGPQKGYYQVFDFNLNPISQLIEISANIGQQAMTMPEIATAVVNDEVYIAYPVVEHEEQFIKLDLVTDKEQNNKEFYLLKNSSVILQNKLINMRNNTLMYYFTDKRNENTYINNLKIDLTKLQ